MPTPTAAPGVKGRRPAVGTWDCKRLLYALAAVNLATAAAHASPGDGPEGAEKKAGPGKARRSQAAFAAHLRHVGRMPPAGNDPRAATLMGSAPWHAGESVRAALADSPHPGLGRRPSHRPRLNPIERLWRVPRRRATHNRPFDTPADLRRSIRSRLSYYQTVRQRVQTLLSGGQGKRTASAGS